MLAAFIAYSELPGIALAFAAIAYLVSLWRDWRPIKALREENRELRAELDELRTRHLELEKRYGELERSRDFQASFATALRAIDSAREASQSEHERLLELFTTQERSTEKALGEILAAAVENTVVLRTLIAGINVGASPHEGSTAA